MGQKIKILLCDDQNEATKTLVSFLKSEGYETALTERNAQKLSDMIANFAPDVVLTDVFLVGGDAISVMKKTLKSANPPIFIVISNSCSPAIESSVMNEGAKYFFLKPIDMNVLSERIAFFTGAVAVPTPGLSAGYDLELMATEMFHQIGVPAHIKGYHFLREAIMLYVENRDMMGYVTKQLYPTIAKRFSTTPTRVERAIRHAIEVAWDRGDIDMLNYYFGYTINNARGKPTNSEFIAMISDKLRLKMRKAN